MSRIGFVGVGNMGGPMARNLVGAGYEVKVFDLVEDLMTAIEGATPQTTAGDAAKGVDVFISMLPAGRHVDALYGGEDGIVRQCDPGTLLIDCSTIDPVTARKVAAAAQARDLSMLDAPVSGGTAGLEVVLAGLLEAAQRFVRDGNVVVHGGTAATDELSLPKTEQSLAPELLLGHVDAEEHLLLDRDRLCLRLRRCHRRGAQQRSQNEDKRSLHHALILELEPASSSIEPSTSIHQQAARQIHGGATKPPVLVVGNEPRAPPIPRMNDQMHTTWGPFD